MIARLGLFLARFCTAAWIGAATLFVIVGIREVTFEGFDMRTRDMLVAVRFPAFYACGSLLVCVAWLGTVVARSSGLIAKRQATIALGLLSGVLLLMALDYLWIFQPLLKLVNPPGTAKTNAFVQYHQASKWINLAGLTLSIAAAACVSWPSRIEKTPASGNPSLSHDPAKS